MKMTDKEKLIEMERRLHQQELATSIAKAAITDEMLKVQYEKGKAEGIASRDSGTMVFFVLLLEACVFAVGKALGWW